MLYDFRFTDVRVDNLKIHHVVECKDSETWFHRGEGLASLTVSYAGWNVMVSCTAVELPPDYQIITALSWKIREIMKAMGISLPLIEWDVDELIVQEPKN